MSINKLVIHQKRVPERTAGALAYEIGVQLNELLGQPKDIEASAEFDIEIGGQRFVIRVDRISFESDGKKYLRWPSKAVRS